MPARIFAFAISQRNENLAKALISWYLDGNFSLYVVSRVNLFTDLTINESGNKKVDCGNDSTCSIL